MGCTVFWQCKIYHWDKSVRLLAIPMHTDFRFIFPVECYFLVHLSRRLKCTIVIMRCPSSVRRPSSLTFHIFDFSSETAERNSTKLDRKQDLNALYQVCVFRVDRKNKMAALASDWLRHFRLLLWNCWTEFNEIWQEARSQRPLPSLCFSGRSEKQDGRPGLWLAETFFLLLLWNRWTEFNETWQEARSQRPLPSLCFSGRSEKQDGRPGLWLAEAFLTSPLKPLNGIQRKLTGSKISTSFYQVCVFRADRKNKMAALDSDWLRHFRLLLWNRWTEFNETWQEARSQHPLPRLCFSGRSEKQDGGPGLWLAETFSTSFLKPLNGIQRNLTGNKIWTSSTKFVFFRLIGKIRWPPWLLIGLDILDFSSETAERPATKHDRKQDLNVLYQVCVFGRSEKQDGRPGQSIKKVAYCTQVHDMWPFWPLVSYHTIFVWSGFRCIPRGGGGGKFYCVRFFLAWARPENLFSGISMPKYLFSSARKFGRSIVKKS